MSKFSFRPELRGHIGVEREQFLVSPKDARTYVPQSKRFLDEINNSSWTYELSACQVEFRTHPQFDLSAIKQELVNNESLGNSVATKLKIKLDNQEVADLNMPLDVYTNDRYLEIARTISVEQLRAACRVAGTHVHIGVGSIEEAISINNSLVPYLETLCKIGDHSQGERLRLYKTMASHWQPVMYENAEHLFHFAQEENFTENPRNCWKLIRISIHGTVELRMFGSTHDVDEIVEWVSFIKSLTPAL